MHSALQLRNPKVLENQIVYRSCKQICLICTPGRNLMVIIQNIKNNLALLEKKILSLSSKAVCSENILEKVDHIKSCQCL